MSSPSTSSTAISRSHPPYVDDVTSAVVAAFKHAMSDDTDTPVPLSVVVALTEAIQKSKGAQEGGERAQNALSRPLLAPASCSFYASNCIIRFY